MLECWYEAEESRLDRSKCHTELPLKNILKTWVMMMMMMMMVVRTIFTNTFNIKANAMAYSHVSHNFDTTEWYPFYVTNLFEEPTSSNNTCHFMWMWNFLTLRWTHSENIWAQATEDKAWARDGCHRVKRKCSQKLHGLHSSPNTMKMI